MYDHRVIIKKREYVSGVAQLSRMGERPLWGSNMWAKTPEMRRNESVRQPGDALLGRENCRCREPRGENEFEIF